jgi:Immunity protein Imm1
VATGVARDLVQQGMDDLNYAIASSRQGSVGRISQIGSAHMRAVREYFGVDRTTVSYDVGVATDTGDLCWFPRRWVVPSAVGRQVAREFLLTGDRPTSLRWEEPDL